MRICSLLVVNGGYGVELSVMFRLLLFCFGSAYPVVNRNQEILHSLRKSILKFPVQAQLYGYISLQSQRYIISFQSKPSETVVLFKPVQ